MSDFYQDGTISTLHDFGTKSTKELEKDLLNFSKEMLLDYNKKNKIEYINDPSNFNLDFTRPTIRNFLKESDQKIIKEINKDFENILFYSPYFIQMILQILLKNIVYVDSKQIVVSLKNIKNLNEITSENIIRRIYQFLFYQSKAPRSKKTRILINEIKKLNFKHFNIRGMIVKKNEEFLIFSR